MRLCVPSRVYCEHLGVKTLLIIKYMLVFRRRYIVISSECVGRLTIQFIMRRVVIQVRGRLFVDEAGGVFCDCCYISALQWLSYYQSTYSGVGILSFNSPVLL